MCLCAGSNGVRYFWDTDHPHEGTTILSSYPINMKLLITNPSDRRPLRLIRTGCAKTKGDYRGARLYAAPYKMGISAVLSLNA